MKKKRNTKTRRSAGNLFPYRAAAIGLGVFVILGLSIGLALYFKPDKDRINAEQEKIAEGISFIQNLEKKSTSEIEKTIAQERKEAALAEMNSDDFNVWAHFGNIVMMGDSRTKEFAHSEFVESRRVLAEDGDSILVIPDYLDTLMDLKPENIILEYGINDMENDVVWPDVDSYIRDLEHKITQIKEAVPNTNVFVQSIFPCIEPELSRLECRQEIPAWNEALKAFCKEKDIPFIDVADLAVTYQDYYEPDGMHFIPSFYEFWAKRLVAEVVTYEN